MNNTIMFLGQTRAVDMGKTGIAQWCLNSLLENDFNVPVIVCDTYLKIPPTSIRIDAEKRNVDQILEAIDKYNVNMIISVHYGWVLPAEVLKKVNYMAFNLHNGKLPNYKGYNMLSHMILNKEKTATTTIHWVDDVVDMGNIAFEETIDIAEDETARSLYDKINDKAKINFKKLFLSIKHGDLIPKNPVQGTGTFYSKHSLDELKKINDPMNFDEVDLKSRAFDCAPFEPAYYMLNDRKIYVTRSY